MSARLPTIDPQADKRPPSDVSAGVGLSGLAGLLAWMAVCRAWPTIGAALGLPGPRAVLDGPNAALVAVLAAALPMALWSLLVDRVHRRASTGIDWTSPRKLPDVLDISVTKLAGLWITWALIGCAYALCRWYWSGQYLFAMHVLAWMVPAMVAGSILYVPWLDRVLVEPKDGAWHFGAMLMGREPFDVEQVRHHWRAWAVKGFYCAFMFSALPGNWGQVIRADWHALFADPLVFAGVSVGVMFMIDVQIAMVGYILTMKPLDAHIRTANPLLAGWLAALICYPPFQQMEAGRPLFYQQNTASWGYWLAGHPGLLWGWAALLVLLTGIYAWATVAFGLRFSNLTHRGVLTNGPYALSRHPAYLAKNLFWWLETLPFLVTSHSLVEAIRNSFFLGCVSAIYFWRAKTEEAHLLSVDAKYRDYHAWMARNGPVTKVLSALSPARRTAEPVLHPAE
jgi:protein-S-isoprenylcysteine O-methyltransferase Ste14